MRELAIAPFGDGRFEIFVDDQLVYSKLKTGEFPDNSTIIRKIKKLA
jgi:selT/selW/selH-like putative selenoprotein